MTNLTAAARRALPKSAFGLPATGAYPMPDKKHAALAKSFAKRFASPSQQATIDTKANGILRPKPKKKIKKR